MGAPWKDLGQKADSEMWVRKMKCGGWTGDGSVGLKLRTQGGCGWDPGVAVGGLCGWRRQQGPVGPWRLNSFTVWLNTRYKSQGVECNLQRCPQRPDEPRGGQVRRAGEFCKVLSASTRKHNSSSWAQRAGFTSPSDRPMSVKIRLCLCPLEGKHVSHFCLFKASFDAACCSPLQPMETLGTDKNGPRQSSWSRIDAYIITYDILPWSEILKRQEIAC